MLLFVLMQGAESKRDCRLNEVKLWSLSLLVQWSPTDIHSNEH